MNCGYTINKYDNKAKLLVTDTASLVQKIETSLVYKDFYIDKEMFDLLNIQKIQISI